MKVLPEQRDDATLTLRQYRSLVEAYRAGDRTARWKVLEWTPKQLAMAQGLIRVGKNLSPTADEKEPPWDAGLLRAAALLHTEAGFLRVRSLDPRELGTQLAIAIRLLDRGAPDVNAFASRWYVVVSRVLRDQLRDEDDEVLLEAARKRFPADGEILCESGALQEARAAGRTIWMQHDRGRVPANWQVEAFAKNHLVYLTRGAQFLRDAVQAGATGPVCRLRLGRIRALLGQDDEAEPILRALQQDPDDAVSYLASMVLGGAAGRRGRPVDAEPCYRAAIARFPRGQSAYVALSEALLSTGRVTEAREALAHTVNGDPGDRREPWWWYLYEPSRVVDARFDALRKEALQ